MMSDIISKNMDKPFALIVEDERNIAALFRHVLDLVGFRTEIVFHGQVAVERLSNSQPEMLRGKTMRHFCDILEADAFGDLL